MLRRSRYTWTGNDLADLSFCGVVAVEDELDGNMIFDLFFDPTRLCTCKFDSTTISSNPTLSTIREKNNYFILII